MQHNVIGKKTDCPFIEHLITMTEPVTSDPPTAGEPPASKQPKESKSSRLPKKGRQQTCPCFRYSGGYRPCGHCDHLSHRTNTPCQSDMLWWQQLLQS